MPDDASGKPFFKQLMTQYGISSETAFVAINEYYKFMYLCATRPERNIPSKAVDLGLAYAYAAQPRLLGCILQKKLKKSVSCTIRGKPRCQTTLKVDYKATVAAYKEIFWSSSKRNLEVEHRLDQFFSIIILAVFILIGVVLSFKNDVPQLVFAANLDKHFDIPISYNAL